MVRWLAALGLVVTLLAGAMTAGSCFVANRAEELKCDTQADCPDGRLCTSGFCIVQDLPPDSPPPITCATSDCASKGGTCIGETCQFNCGVGQCAGLGCPEGVACAVTCTGAGACAGGVSCGEATSCNITCGAGACTSGIACGNADCEINCADNACTEQITCSNDCKINCTGASACAGGVQCGNSNSACEVNCTGTDSCGASVACDTMACYCDINCDGSNACAGGFNCKNQCKVAAGCDPNEPGCNPTCGAP